MTLTQIGAIVAAIVWIASAIGLYSHQAKDVPAAFRALVAALGGVLVMLSLVTVVGFAVLLIVMAAGAPA